MDKKNVWVVEKQDNDGSYWPYLFFYGRKEAREMSREVKDTEFALTRVVKYIPEYSVGSQV